jgi:O-antigen/teichoic acid export membrane protein
MDKKKELFKNTIIIFLGKAMTQLISFLLLPLYTSFLITKDYGIVDLITTYVTLIIPIVTLETEMSIFRYLVDARKDKDNTKKLISNDFYILIISLIIFIILYIIVTSFWHISFRWLILLDIIFGTLSGNFLQIARGLGKTIDYAIGCIISGATIVVCNVLFIVVFKMGALGMILSMVVSNILCDLYLFFKLKLGKNIDFKLKDNKLMKELFKYSIPLIPSSISWWIVSVSDRTIVSIILGTAANGIYAVSNKFPAILSGLLGVFNLSWSESAALHINAPDRDQFFSDITNTATNFFTALGVGMIAVMPFLFPILVNSKYNDAYMYIPILVLGAVFNVVVCLFTAVYIAKKLTKQVANTTIVGAIINIVVDLALIKFIGLYAAAVSTAVAYFVMMIYRYIDLKKYINIKFERGLVFRSIIIFTLAIIAYYINNLYLNIASLIVVIIYAYLTNKDFLKSSKNMLLEKFRAIK